MNTVKVCPSCGYGKFRPLHRMELKDIYQDAEQGLNRRNHYERNWILFRKVLQGVDRLKVEFLICRRCGFVFFTPRPSDDDLGKKYDHIAASGITEKRENAYNLVDLRERRSREIADRVLAHINLPLRTALDIGGADGHCLSAFGLSVKRDVLDYETRVMWEGVDHVGCTLSALPSGQKYDLVLSCHTLEHISSLHPFLAGIKAHIEPEGILYIEVPQGVQGEIFTTGNILTHLNFFSTASLTFLLEEAGFQVECCSDGAVLSKKRYLPVIIAVARRIDKSPHTTFTADAGYTETLKEMKSSHMWTVFLKNVFLVLSNPLAYAVVFPSYFFKSLKGWWRQ